MPTAPPRRLAPILFTLVAIVTLASGACGGDSPAENDGASSTSTIPPEFLEGDVQVIADDINFPTDAYTAPAGEMKISYLNEGKIRHTLVIEDVDDFPHLTVDQQGSVDSGTVTLGAGEYVLYCDVAGHRRAGMEATLTVEG